MKKHGTLILIIAQSVIILILLIMLVLQVGSNANADRSFYDVDKQSEMTADSFEKPVNELETRDLLLPFPDEVQIQKLKRLGLSNPVEDLRMDLMSKRDLIHQSGVSGGTMDFYFPDAIHILNSHWAMAYFEDGHNAGALLLKFNVENGRIDWQVLDEVSF